MTTQSIQAARREDRQIADIIRRQLGAGVLMRTGAHKLGYIRRGLAFKVGGKRQTYIRIKLTALDLYDIEMVKIVPEGRLAGVPTGKMTITKTFDHAEGVHVEQLQETVLRMTGEMDS